MPENYFEGHRAPGCCYLDNLLLFRELDPAGLNRQAWKAHWHHRYVLVIPWSGEGTVVVDRSPRAMGPGQAVLIFPYQLHYYQVEPQSPFAWLFLTFESAARRFLEPLREQVLEVTPSNRTRLQDLLTSYLESPLTGRTNAALVLQAGLILQSLEPIRPSAAPDLGAIEPWLDRVQTAVVEAFPQPPAQALLAKQLGLSLSHLRRQFLAKTGMNLGYYIRSLRLQLIGNQLSRHEVRLAEVADACGFSSQAAFSQFFLRHMGMSPRAYRAQLLGDSDA